MFFPTFLKVQARCCLPYLQHWRTLKVDKLAIETGNNFIDFSCLFDDVNLAEVI